MYLFELLYQYIEENYLSASLGSNYEYLNFTKTATTLLMIVGGLCLGMMIACVAAYIQKKHIGKFIRTLLAEKAHDKQAAKSLAELGFDKNALIKHELSIPSATRKLIAVVEDDEVFTFLESMISSLGVGLGFLLAMVLFAGVRSRIENCPSPKCFKGVPITLVAASIVALAFFGFAGVVENLLA